MGIEVGVYTGHIRLGRISVTITETEAGLHELLKITAAKIIARDNNSSYTKKEKIIVEKLKIRHGREQFHGSVQSKYGIII